MKCKLCNTDMFIDHADYEITGDTSPDLKTVVSHVAYFYCPNKDCNMTKQLIRGENTVILEKGAN